MYRSFKAIKYKPSIEVMTDLVTPNSPKVLCYVKLTSRGYKELVVGVFDTIHDADKFMLEFYPDGKVYDIKYCNNRLTREYLNER